MTLPCAVNIERWVLGTMMLYPAAMDVMRPELSGEDFSLDIHRTIWKRACEIYDRGERVDRITLFHELERNSEAQSVGGLSYIISLDDGLPEVPAIDPYIAALKDKTIRRRVIIAASHLMNLCEDSSSSDTELQEAASALSRSFDETNPDRRPISTRDLLKQYGLDALLSERKHSGIRLPWPRIDHALMGFGSEQMIVLMAETSRGKTSAALQCAYHAALQGIVPMIWTMEMSAESLFRRIITQMSQVSGMSFKLTYEDREKQREAVGYLNEHPIYFDRHSRNVASFCASIRQVRAKATVGLAIVDYLQLIRSDAVNRQTRAQEVSNNSRSLKLASVDFRIPFLVLSQVDRNSVKNGGEITIHSGKESGDIENDADVLMWIKADELSRDHDTPVKMWIGKQREGPAGFGIPMMFRPLSQTFLEVDNDV